MLTPRSVVRSLQVTVSPPRLALIAAAPLAPVVFVFVVQGVLLILRIRLRGGLEMGPMGIVPASSLVDEVAWAFAMGCVLSLVCRIAGHGTEASLRTWRPWHPTALFPGFIVLGGLYAAMTVIFRSAVVGGESVVMPDLRWGMALLRLSIVIAGWAALALMGPRVDGAARAGIPRRLFSLLIVAATVAMPWLLEACGLEFIGDGRRSQRGYVVLLGLYGQSCICLFGVMWLGALWATTSGESDA